MRTKDPHLLLYDGQWGVQRTIIFFVFIGILLLLFGRPIYYWIVKRKERGFNFFEIFVMNLIEMIHFCLSAFSHTASYLRLWAMSLANTQLSHVFYRKFIIDPINSRIPFILILCFAAYCALVTMLLLLMEGFASMIHGMRLMWVEFSSKFYKGMGVPFRPCSFKKELKKLGVIMD